MDLSELTIKLIMLLIPGAVCTIIIDRLTIHKTWSSFTFIVNVILTGCLSYLIYQLLINIPHFIDSEGYDFTILGVWKLVNDSAHYNIPFEEIFWSSVIAIFLGFTASAFIQNKLLNKLANWLRVSQKYGDENLYSYFLNSPITDEVYVRDQEKGITYHGLVEAYSEDKYNKEILLSDVTVYYSETSKKLYELEKIYLCKAEQNLIIELPFKENS